jgi:hypothetical protein
MGIANTNPAVLLDAAEMIRALRTHPLLTGFRGSVVADVAALEEGLLRVSAMVKTYRRLRSSIVILLWSTQRARLFLMLGFE